MSRAAEGPLPPERFEEILRRRAPAFGLELSDQTLTRSGAYLSTLDSWRRKTNLTGDLTSEELVDHTLESVLCSSLIAHGERVVDVGSGAGFPGVPLAIARPDLPITLVEPRFKRAAFLRHVVRALALSNLTVFEGRVEEVGGQTYDVATTRAVGDVRRWLGDGRLIRSGGSLMAWTTKPGGLAAEIRPAFRLERSLEIPESRQRQIAVFRRV
jgi:16S rRNA (guanine527-N7)-methyltransferase